jgi:hypothetical protein
MATYDDFLRTVLADLKTLAETTLVQMKDLAFKDASAFVQSARADLERWTSQLANGQLTPKDFEDLVKGEEDLATLEALKQAGLAQARVAQFQADLLDTVVKSALKVFV